MLSFHQWQENDHGRWKIFHICKHMQLGECLMSQCKLRHTIEQKISPFTLVGSPLDSRRVITRAPLYGKEVIFFPFFPSVIEHDQ